MHNRLEIKTKFKEHLSGHNAQVLMLKFLQISYIFQLFKFYFVKLFFNIHCPTPYNLLPLSLHILDTLKNRVYLVRGFMVVVIAFP